ncbi:MAG: sigma-54-dependent Fis family transcriptional regulator [Planctomycetales bacterium]|nr:sigma-54-dependent Fis family transcriptional regulator [Planctomycetales bacterium]
MKPELAWIVTDDRSLAERVELSLEGVARGVVRVPVADWLGAGNLGRPGQVVLDLRQSQPLAAELWASLDGLGGRLSRLTEQAIPVIGITDLAIPLGSMVAADRWLGDTVTWPASSERLQQAWRTAMRATRSGLEETREFREIHSDHHSFRTYTRSLFPAIERLERAAAHDFTILIVGETGTGKTTLANLIHELSPRRREHRFLTVACGALPGDLIDSELFGHVKGAFTGADRLKAGKFEAAGPGTILLDEIDVLGLLQQAKLLRVLETGQYEMVGSNETIQANCRTIVASNVPLESLVDSREFRADLYYRLNQVKIEIPPLRDRPLDIIPLAAHFARECCDEHGLDVQSIHIDMLRILKSYDWPGNIRELRNEVRRAVLFVRDATLAPDALSLAILEKFDNTQPADTYVASSALAQEVASTERESIELMLRKQGYNRAATARALGISRVTLYNKLRKYRIDVDQMSDDD